MRQGPIPYELIEALEGYFERHPEQASIVICSGTSNGVKMGDIPKEIKKGTKVGIDYEKSLYKMAFDDLVRGRKKMEI